MKTEFMIRLKTTRTIYGYGIRMYINELRTKYYAGGGGYDKVGDIFKQFIKDNFLNSNLFKESKRGNSSCKNFIESIGGIFEIIDERNDLYYISFDSSELKPCKYKITKNSKDQSVFWINDRIEKIFNNHNYALEYLEKLKSEQVA